jgi:hypothetical protein
MSQKTNLNVPPYHDDFDAGKSYYKVLFRPGYSIQTRELTTLQSILQNQIESVGRSRFKQGQQVIPGEVSFNNRLNYVKLSSISEVAVNINDNIVFQKYDIKNLIGVTIQGLSSGVTATVVSYSYGSAIESDMLFVKYTNSGNSNTEFTFRQGETLEALNISDTPTLVVGTDGSVLPTTIDIKDYDTGVVKTIDSPAMAFASAVQVEEGVYFINGYFVNNKKELIVVDKYYSKPSVKVGFNISESVVTPEEDKTLYDNSKGFSNFSAPGAHRLKIDLSLNVIEYDQTTDENYVQLVTIKNGEIQQIIKPSDYELIEEILARRTYDESGDYVVNDFSLDLREYYQKNNNKGIYPLNKETELVNKKPIEEAESLMVAGVGPGKAYIKGYEIINKDAKYLDLNKSRDTLLKEDNRIKINSLAYFNVTNTYGSIPLNAEGQELTAYPTVYLNTTYNDGSIGSNNTESITNKKQTVSRRNKTYSVDDGVVTLTLDNPGKFSSASFPTASTFGTSVFNELWYVVNKGTAPATTTVRSLELLSYSVVERPFDITNSTVGSITAIANISEADPDRNPGQYTINSDDYTTDGAGFAAAFTVIVDPSGAAIVTLTSGGNNFAVGETITISALKLGGNGDDVTFDVETISSSTEYLELTVKGNKEDIYAFLKEYDDTDSSKKRKLFASETDAKAYYFQTGIPTIFPYSEILDYNEIVTPIIGVCKPKDFSLIEKGIGFNTDIDKILSKGRLSSGITTYNSIFRLAYFNPTFFTRIILDSDLPIQSVGFSSGQYVVGSTSGAYGVVEGSSVTKYSVGNILMVKTLSGKFLPGETITDEKGNSRRIAREGTISHFVVMNRGGGYPFNTNLKINGVNYDNSSIEVGITAGTIYKAIIKDRNLVSQVYSTTPEVTFETGNVTPPISAVVKPILFGNTVYTYNPENVKSLHSFFGAGSAYKFTADVESSNLKYITSKTVTDFTFSGRRGEKYLTCNGFSGDPSNELVQGDVIEFTNDNNVSTRVIVQRVEKSEGLVKARIYIDNVLRDNVSNSSVVRIRPFIENSSKSTLIIPTGSKYLNSIVQNSEDSKIKYYFRRDFVTTASTSGGNITFAAQLPFGTQRFTSFTENNFILTVLDKRSATTVESGDILYLKSEQVIIENTTSNSSGLTAGSVRITLPSEYFGTTTDFPILKLSATLEVSKSRPRLKTIYRNKRILVVSPGDRIVPVRGIDFDSNSTDILSYSDVVKVYKIFEGTIQNPPVISATNSLVTGTDVTERFTFDDGQRDTFYDVSRLVLKPGFDPPTGQLIIIFDYFEHSQGDFCTVDSYLHESGVGIDEIPNFNSNVLGKVSLRDVFDFRPKVDSSATISGYQDTSILSLSDYNSFTGSGGVSSSTPATEKVLDYSISFNLKQYLDRIDGIYLDKSGNFFVKEGNASLNPTKPEDISDAIALYYLYIPAYTTSSQDVRIIPVDNRRYTMRDIGKLEKRIERLEQYTLLSILEQQSLNMQVKDDLGIDKVKSGFVVDNYENHGVGNTASEDYNCSIDPQQSTLRPRSVESSFNLIEVNTIDEQRTLDNYKKSGPIITLPFNSVSTLANPYATKTININPFVVLQYVGDASLSTPVDSWYDDKETPIILDNDSKLFSVFYSKSDAREGFSSIHNNFIVNWVGANRVFYNVTSLNNISTFTSSSSTITASNSSSSNISPQNNQLAQGINTKSVGTNTVSSSIQQFCRSIPVFFKLTRLQPSTRFYVFMDGRNVDRWAIQDFRYTGIPGNSLSTFNSGITTDVNGNASGMILIPSGYPPQSGSTWNNDINSVIYDTETGDPVSFTVGEKTIRFTSSSSNADISEVSSFTEVKYYATGILPQQPSSIISTIPAILKANEGIQLVELSKTQSKPNPLSQTFSVEKTPGGVFVTGVDLFFSKKSSTIPVKLYLSNVESDKPGKYIIPGSECVLNPDTHLKIYTNGTASIDIGEIVTGTASSASGPISKVYDRNGVELLSSINGQYTLTNDQVYTLILNNHNGKSFLPNEELNIPSVVAYNSANATALAVTIARDSGRVVGLKINNTGIGYETASLTVESPQLIGGVNATATCKVFGGNIYDTNLIVGGSGYTDPPSVIISSTGVQASGADIEAILEIDTPAVSMGVAIDPGNATVSNSTTPTRFNFEYPVYLQNNTKYAFGIESDSTDYEIWCSRLGEVEIADGSTVSSQPLLGSLFKSQNVDTWTENLFEDIKFTLYRAEFNNSVSGVVTLTNEQLNYELIDNTPFETDSLSDSTATSTLFKNNNKIIKLRHKNNGFDNSKSYVAFKNAEDVGGVSSNTLNNTLFKVSNVGSDFYTISVTSAASSNAVGGGNQVLALYNRKYEKLYSQVSYLNFNETKISAEVKTTNILPIDSKVTSYNTYSQMQENGGYEKTFLNQEHYFNNQKVLASRINELKNNNLIENRSLDYKIKLESSSSLLSPVIDLRTCSVKLINNKIEKSTGSEDRYGKRNQVVKFYPIYKFNVSGFDVNTINPGDTGNPKVVTGNTSGASGVIVKFDTSVNMLYVKMLTDTLFAPSETLKFGSQPSLTTISVAQNGITEETFNFTFNSTVEVIDKTDVTKRYTNIISGKVFLWDAEKKELIVSNNKNPINNNYTSAATPGSDYARIPFSSSSSQRSDIFRVGDLIGYENQLTGTEGFLEIKSVSYSTGVLFVPEINKNSSSIAKYVTKEINLENSATGIDVRLTANIFEEDDIQVLYKIKPVSSQFNFDDLGWQFFNGDGSPDIRVIPASDNSIAGYIEEQESYKEYKFSATNLNEFSSFAIKIIMRSSNPVYVPKIQDARVVASF